MKVRWAEKVNLWRERTGLDKSSYYRALTRPT
jgi:hypothetical protein